MRPRRPDNSTASAVAAIRPAAAGSGASVKPAADGQPPAQAALDRGSRRPQIVGQAEARQAWQARRAAEARCRQGCGQGRACEGRGCQRGSQGRRQGATRQRMRPPKPSGEGPSQSAKVDAPKETVGETAGAAAPIRFRRSRPRRHRRLRCPQRSPTAQWKRLHAPAATTPVAPAEPPSLVAVPPSVTAAAPSLPPVPPAGPPAPPISQ